MTSGTIAVIGFTEIVLVVAGVLMMLAAPVGLIVYLVLHRRRQRAAQASEPPSAPNQPQTTFIDLG